MASGINVIFSITDLASSALANVRSEMSRVASGITQASTALFFWSEGFNQIKAASSQFYNAFIGQNEKMRQQILATQSNLAAVQDVYINGVKSIDPTETIQAFEAPIRKSLNQIAIESLDLVGVTSGQLTDLLQIALTNATKITNQSKDFADPIKAAERLTLSFAGAFGAMQIPLFQARQEINSILSGTIDMNSRLAKGLSITNEQVRAWGSQGVLVDKLVNKLQPFVAGNALAARSVSGISSNIQEIFEITTRLAGENITKLFVDGLDVIYQYMKNIQPQIQSTLNGVTAFISDSVKQIIEIISPFLPTLAVLRDAVLSIGGSIGEIIGGSVQTLLNVLATVAPIIAPIFELLVLIVKVVADLLSDPVIQQMVQLALIITTVIGPLTTIATVIATISGTVAAISGFFAAGGSMGTFFVLLSTIAPGLVVSLNALGVALASIAGFGGAAGAIAASGSMMTVLGGAIASVAVALGPLALAIAAVAAAARLMQSFKVDDARQAIEAVGARSDVTASGANNTTLKLRQLRDTEIIQGELTDKQKADKEALTSQARNYATQLEAEIAAAKEINTAGDESLENAKAALIASNEQALKGLGKFTSGLTTSAKPLTELGGIFTQVEKKVAAFEAQIKAANSDPEFQTANKGIIELITKQVQLGQLSAEEGKKRLNRILDDSRVEIAGKEAAQKAIAQLQEISTKKQLDQSQIAQSEIEKMQNEGRVGEVKAEQMVTDQKLKEIKIRSDSQKTAHAEKMRQIQAEMNADLGVIDKEVADKQAVLDKLKAAKVPEVQVVQAQRDLDSSKSRRTSKQAKFGEIQIEENRKNATEAAKLDAERSKLEKQQRDVRKREALKDFDERQKINDSARERGLKDNQEAARESIQIAEGRAKLELAQIKDRTAKLEAEAKKQGKTVKEYDKEAWEALQVQQAEALQKLAAARKDGFEKRLSDIKQDAQEATAIVEASQAKNEIDNQKAATKTAEIATKSINTQIALIAKEIAANQGNKERLEELNAKRAGLEKDLTEVQKKQLQQRLSDLQQDADERVSVVKARNATGAIDNQQAAKQTAAIETATSKTQLQIIQARIAEVIAADKKRGKVSTELLEELRKQEADTQVKITEIAKKEMETRLADLKEDVAERTAVIKASQATGAIDNQAAATQTAAIERTGAAQRLEIVRQRIQQIAAEGKKSGKVNVELMEALKKQEAEIQVEITDIDKKAMDARLSDLQQDTEERVAVVQAANTLGTKDNQQAAIATSQIQQKSANDQLKIVRERIATVIEEGKKSGKVNTELLEELRKREADIQVKITEIQKQELQKRLSDLQQDAEERTAVITAANATGVLDNQEAATKTAKIQQDSLESQLKLIKQRIKTTNPANKEFLEELRKQEADTQVKITEIQKQVLQKRLADLREDTEERTALIAAANATGIINNQQAATQTAKVQQDGLNAELELIRKRISIVGPKNKELLEELRKQEADIQVKITEVQKQEIQKRLSDLDQDATERIAIAESANAQGLLDNQQTAAATAKIQETSANKQIEIISKRIDEVRAQGQKTGKVNAELLEELQAQEANAQKKIADIQKQFLQKQLSDLQQDADERLSVVTALNAKGDIDNQAAAVRSSAIQRQNLDSQLALIQNQLKAVGITNKELREELLKQEADIQVRITEAQKQELQKRLADLREDNDERIALITAANAIGAIDNQQAAMQTAKAQQESLDRELELIRQRISTVAPANKELLEELRKQEADIQIKITEIQKQELQKRLSDLEQDATERIAITESANAQGLLDNQQVATETAKIQTTSAAKQIELIRNRIEQVRAEGQKNGKVNIELLEELQAQEANAQKKLTEIQKQELQKRLSDLQQDSQERVALVEAAAATGAKDNQQAATEIESIQRQSVNDQLKLVRERIAATSPLNKELSEELKAQEAKLQKELTEIQEQGFQKRLSDLQQDAEERLAIVTANGVRGVTDNQETATKTAAIQEESAQQQLKLIRDRLAQTSELSIELREKLLKQEADTQAKIAEIRKQAFDKRLADVEQDGQEQQTILEGQLAQGLTTEAEYAESRYNQSLQSLDAQLVLIQERRSQISATDVEGQEALAAQEASLQKRRQDALSQFLEAQLSLLDRENKKATDLLEQSELDRKLITKQAALSGVADKDAAATAEIQATQRRIQQEIALEEQKNATLRSLPAFSDPAKEAERQSRIRASVKKTTELRLQLLDEEKKAFDLLVERQIKGIQNQSRAQELASDAQVRSIEQQGKQYDLLSRSLENQNKLLQSRASLANALNGYIQGEYKILQDSASSEGERKRLIKEAADAQLIAMQQQQVVAQKNLDIEIKQAEIAQKRAEFEAEIAEIRARAGSAKADAEVLKAEVNLQKVQRDPNASNADVEAARLDVVAARAGAEAAVAEVAGAIANKEMVGQNGEVLKVQNDLKRETQSIEQVTQGRAAQAQAIEAIVDENEKKLRQRQLAGRLTPEESERLARVQQQNRERETIRQQNEAERNTLMGVPANGMRRGIQAAGARSGSLLQAIEQTATTAPKVPDVKNLVAQMNVQRQQISAIKPDVNPLIRLQEESTGYQREILGVLKQLNGKPAPAPVTPVSNNFNIKAEAGISEAQVLGVFSQVSQQVTQMLKR